MTLLEMVIALAMMVIIIAVFAPQLKTINDSWASKKANAEVLQNARVFMDQVNRSLSSADKITDVSNSAETDGYIEFEDNTGTPYRMDIAVNNYIEFGPVGSLSDLAGPVSQLRFTCYSKDDFTTPTTVANDIRFVKAEVIFPNPGPGQDRTFTTSTYLRTNASIAADIEKETPFEYEPVTAKTPALAQIDSNHYLCAYTDKFNDGCAVVLTVDTGTWNITKGAHFEYDTSQGVDPALAQIDSTHYLCVYEQLQVDGWSVVLTVDTGTWNITKETPLEYSLAAATPALARIDSSHYLCVYEGVQSDGFAEVLTVDTGTWNITSGTPFEYDTYTGESPALAQIDSSHYLCAYVGRDADGFAVVLTVDTGTWNITKETPLEYDTVGALTPALSKIDNSHYLCVYTDSFLHGQAVVLTVDTGTWNITKGTPFEFETVQGMTPALAQIDSTHYLCAYTGPGGDGWVMILTVDTGTWNITSGTPFEYDITLGVTPVLANIDTTNNLCAYEGDGADGWTVILKTGGGGILP